MDEQQKDEAMRTIYLGGPQNEISQPKMETARQSGPQNRKPAGKKIFRRWPILALALVVVLAVILLGLFWPGAKKVNSYKDKWQTVFLNNGQVYFGHIVFENEQAVVLQDVYYPQKPVPLQQGAEAMQPSDFTIVKFGGEIYGMEDEMKINRETVLFIANLKEDSKIIQAIKKHQEKK